MSYVPQPVSVAAMLCRELSGAAGGPPRVKLSAEDPFLDGYVAGGRGARSPYPYGKGMLLALETLGLLTSEQTAAWSRRFDLAAEGWSPGPAAGRKQRQLAEDHLRRLVASLHEAADRHARRALLDRLNGAFSFCLQTGLVDPADAPEWGTTVEEALGETVEQFETAEAEEGLGPDEFSEPHDVQEPEFRPPESMGALVRVVPAEPARHEGWSITAVALHQGGFEIHWHALGKEAHDPDRIFPASSSRLSTTSEPNTGRPGRAGRSPASAKAMGRSRCWDSQSAPPQYGRAHGNFASGGLARSG